jgi:DNA modification methylase
MKELIKEEKELLQKHETTIKKGLNTFVEVGQALLEIRDKKLYRIEYKTFEEYCQEKWQISRRRSYELINASIAIENVRLGAQMPKNEKEVRPLTRLEPEVQNAVWQETVEKHGDNITAKKVQEVANDWKETSKEINEYKQTITTTEDELKRLVDDKVKEVIESRKNNYLQVANKIKTQKIKEQSTINKENAIDWQLKKGDVFLINDKHKLIVNDSYDTKEIKKHITTVDCVLTDPPYGISYKSPQGNALTQRGNYEIIEGDEEEFEPNILFKYSNNVITWGANHYANKLNNSAGWLVWDKRQGSGINLNSDCELAYTNMINSARLFHHTWNGMIKASEKNEKRLHPTQKPIKLFVWCLEVTKAGNNILDLFSGSGSVLIACEESNRSCVAVEKNLEYAAASLNRFKSLDYKIEKI